MVNNQVTSASRPPIKLAVNDITVTYGNGHTAIHDASFTLNGGSICGLAGVNGSGKSTLFKAIMGLVNPGKGQVTLDGQLIRNALKQNRIAYVPQSEDVDWNFPVLVKDVVMMGRYGQMNFLRLATKHDHQLVNQALLRVNMQDYQYRQIGELSGGQRKRVFLARALAQKADVLLLDEPFTGVDVTTENAIIALLKELRTEGNLILVSTHNLGSIPDFCDHVVFVNQTVLASGSIETTFTQQNLQRAFGGVLRNINLFGKQLHDDDDNRIVSVVTDDEKPVIFYGEHKQQKLAAHQHLSGGNNGSD